METLQVRIASTMNMAAMAIHIAIIPFQIHMPPAPRAFTINMGITWENLVQMPMIMNRLQIPMAPMEIQRHRCMSGTFIIQLRLSASMGSR